MVKIFSGLTLLAALGAIFFGFQSKDLVSKLRVAADREHTDRVATLEKLKKTEKDLATTKEDLAAAKDELGKTKDALAKTEADLTKAKGDLATATDELATAKGKVTTLEAKIKEMAGEGDPAEMAKQVADMKAKIPELEGKVSSAEKEIAELKTVNETLTAHKKESEEKLASQHKVIDRYQKNIMQKGTRGQVLAVNAGWGFCVLSIGDRKGAAANKVMIVARNGEAIGKVKIINVEATQSVADIIPSSFTRGTYVEPGDDVVFTGEDKVREEPADAAGKAPSATTLPVVPALPQP